jgi:multimeric flavodoxin WrbA
MKVIAINGSLHSKGNTYHALDMVGVELKKAGIEFEVIHIGRKSLHRCLACNNCATTKDEQCTIKTDDLNKYIQKMKDADGILLGSSSYYLGVSGTMKCFLDRVFQVAESNKNLFRHKVAAAVISAQHPGSMATFDSLNRYLTYSEMIIAGSGYWNVNNETRSYGMEYDGKVQEIMQILGKNMCWILKMKETAKHNIQVQRKEVKEMTEFIS